MAKVHTKNGFEYTHEVHNFGSWVHIWSFRPEGRLHWKTFSIPSGTAKKSDIELFLKDPAFAHKDYEEWIERVGNIDLAKEYLIAAQRHLEHVSHPDWGGRGNNPNREVRIVRQARDAVDSASRALEYAEKINSK